MSLLSSILLGLIQGVSEFLPISSSGHLSIAQNLFHIQAAGGEHVFFDVLLHLGTLIAVFIAYWSDIREMIREFFSSFSEFRREGKIEPTPPRRMIFLLILGTLPLFVVLPIKKYVEALYYHTGFIGGALLVTGVLLFLSDRARKGRKTEKTATVADILLVGVGQAIATCPGISRSGMTICMGMFRGFDRRFAVRFSFLLSIPAVLGANILSIAEAASSGGIDVTQLPVYLVGVLAAAVSGYLCIRLLKMIADKGRFGWFAYYCWGVGILTLVMTFLK